MQHEASTFSMILCQLLVRKMEANGMTQKEFFEKSGISQATWSRINRGQSALTTEDLHAAAQTLGSSLSELMDKADLVSKRLPEMDVELVEVSKKPRGPKAKKAEPTSNAATVITAVIATAALAFLISRILRS